MSRPPLSVIIPCYNGLPRLADGLTALMAGLGAGLVREAIVVDGASSDQSAALATDMGCSVIVLEPEMRGRGRQLQAGAQSATGEWLLFLHADTVLQDNWVEAVMGHIDGAQQAKAAHFQLAFDSGSAGARRVAGLANFRARVLGLPYGDAGLLISRSLYDAVGGYQAFELMEDIDLVRRLGKHRLVSLPAIAQTSAAKFVSGGWWRVSVRNIFLASAFILGIKPKTLAGWYQ